MFNQRPYNHKGERCGIYPSILCQEGWCADCWLYQLSMEQIEDATLKSDVGIDGRARQAGSGGEPLPESHKLN